MKILTAANRLAAIGGLELAQLEACRQLHGRGHQIELLYLEDGDLAPRWAEFTERRRRVQGYALFRGAPLSSPRSMGGTAVAVRRLDPDLVYIHHQHHSPAAVLGGRPVVCHLHLPPAPKRSLQDELALRRCRALVAVSRFTAEQWSEALGVPRDRFTIVANGVDPARFSPSGDDARARVRAGLDLPRDKFLVVFAGRVDPEKGVDRALDAMRLLDPGSFHMAVAGEANPGSFGGDATAAGSYARDLRNRYADVNVTWLGRLPDVASLLSAADVVILPSRFPDPLPLIVLETLASGTPIVASAVGGIPEMLTGPLAENLVRSGEPAEFAARVRSLRDWRVAKPELGSLGREHVERNFSLRKLGDRITQTIETAAGDGRHG
jgi:glycosyltransferase involved in cell wall biosynthesis